MPEEITIKDVAKLVGFSTGTVSRVLNGAPNVNPEINSRILRVLKESGYLAKERYRPGAGRAAAAAGSACWRRI